MPVLKINNLGALNNSINKPSLSVIDFSATWCKPCKRIAPVVNNLSNIYKNCSFYKIEIDKVDDIGKIYDIRSLPTFIFFKNGKVIDRISGIDTIILVNKIKKYI